jgi:shikimate dehydrogenase
MLVDQYAVMGHPISHSRSPRIHSLFAQQTGQSLVYTAMDVEPSDFESTVSRFFSEGGRGLNITVPFKERACAMAAVQSAEVAGSGAANTLLLDSRGFLRAENTDGVGLLTDLKKNHGANLAGARILLLGAGGAVRGVLPALLAEAPEQICILNRSFEKARLLAEQFNGPIDLRAIEPGDPLSHAFDFVINGTSAGIGGLVPEVPAGALHEGTWCYDMMYGCGETAFQKWARMAGAREALDGLGMLVEQAAKAFSLWRGITPQTEPVIALLRQELSAQPPAI